MSLVFLGAEMEIKAVELSSAPLFPKTLPVCCGSAGVGISCIAEGGISQYESEKQSFSKPFKYPRLRKTHR